MGGVKFARLRSHAEARPPIPPALPPGRLINVPGRGEVFVRDTGDGRPARPGELTVLLLHGWTASADLNWFAVFDVLARHGRVIAVDHRGHGRGIRSAQRFTLEDAADDAAGVLQVLGTGPAVVVGYSMGGPIAALLWRRHRHLVRGLVFEATALEWQATGRERIVFKFMVVLEYLMRLGRPRSLMEHYLRKAVRQCPEIEPLYGWLKGELRRGDPEALADAGRALASYDGRPFAQEIDAPTAVVVTTKDRLVRARKQRRLAAAIPSARTFEIPVDHDCPLMAQGPFRQATEAAVVDVVRRTSVTSSSKSA